MTCSMRRSATTTLRRTGAYAWTRSANAPECLKHPTSRRLPNREQIRKHGGRTRVAREQGFHDARLDRSAKCLQHSARWQRARTDALEAGIALIAVGEIGQCLEQAGPARPGLNRCVAR